MSSLKSDFSELLERIRHGRELGHASFEPIYYLVSIQKWPDFGVADSPYCKYLAIRARQN